jgi:hypothetical protein
MESSLRRKKVPLAVFSSAYIASIFVFVSVITTKYAALPGDTYSFFPSFAVSVSTNDSRLHDGCAGCQE